jgi:hypothetical protein
MRFFLLLFMLLPFSLQSEVIANQQFSEFLSRFSYMAPQVQVPFCAEGEMAAEEKAHFQKDAQEIGFQKIACPDPWNEREFYRRIHVKYCSSRFGASAFTCAESDPVKIVARAGNMALMKNIKSFTRTRFEDYKSNLAGRCCGDKVKCKARFLAVELKIGPGTKAEASYESDSDPSASSLNNRIVISEGKLASAYNTENVERVLLVELAHACQFALVSENKDDYRAFTSPSSRCDKASGLLMFREGLGKDVSQCVIDELEGQISEIPARQKNNYCFGKWYREAFSDMMFRSEFTSPYHWTYDMGRRSIHKNYGSVFKYIRCAFPEDWKEKICL